MVRSSREQARRQEFTVGGSKIIRGTIFLNTILDVYNNWGAKYKMGGRPPLAPSWRRSCNGGTASLKKIGPRRLSRYPSLVSILELAIWLVGKAHVTKVKLHLNFFPSGLRIPQISYCIFKPVICTNLMTCSAKLSFHAAERGQYIL